jgi:hypothetical protein
MRGKDIAIVGASVKPKVKLLPISPHHLTFQQSFAAIHFDCIYFWQSIKWIFIDDINIP